VKTRCHGLWLCGSLGLFVVPQLGCQSTARTQPQQAMTPHTYSAGIELSYCRGNGSLYIPLWVETPPSREIHHCDLYGVKIEGVEADGRRVPALDILVNWEAYPCAEPLRVDHPFFVYLVELDTWNYRRSGDEDEKPKNWSDYELRSVKSTENDCEQVAYRIPYNARRIKIEYRLRYPVDGREELGPLITVVAERHDNTLMTAD
jgi:hypothetical protein